MKREIKRNSFDLNRAMGFCSWFKKPMLRLIQQRLYPCGDECFLRRTWKAFFGNSYKSGGSPLTEPIFDRVYVRFAVIKVLSFITAFFEIL
ncbi:MAG TPA: hypothetical protein DDX91_08770 [Ruminococcaceae bacterium]|nr:hypothetical protein [Oscillospiraceae bacterium]